MKPSNLTRACVRRFRSNYFKVFIDRPNVSLTMSRYRSTFLLVLRSVSSDTGSYHTPGFFAHQVAIPTRSMIHEEYQRSIELGLPKPLMTQYLLKAHSLQSAPHSRCSARYPFFLGVRADYGLFEPLGTADFGYTYRPRALESLFNTDS